MAYSLLIAKLVAVFTSASAIAVGSGYGIKSLIAKSPTTLKPMFVQVFPDSVVTSISPEKITQGSTSKNYKCKITKDNKAKPVVCKLVKWDPAAKWSDIVKINGVSTQKGTQSNSLSVGSNYFQLLLEDSLYSSIKWTPPTQMDIVDADNHTTKLGSLITLFPLKNIHPIMPMRTT